jgi:hypothetical protein
MISFGKVVNKGVSRFRCLAIQVERTVVRCVTLEKDGVMLPETNIYALLCRFLFTLMPAASAAGRQFECVLQ